MSSGPTSNLAGLLREYRIPRPWRVELVLPEIGGGRLSLDSLSAIEKKPRATQLTISGLDQDTFESLVVKYGSQFLGIHFWKCPRIADLSALEQLPGLTHVAFYWNQRATRLWDLSRNPNLRGLQFEDFSKLHDLSDLASAASLEELRFGNAVWAKSVFESLGPLQSLESLRSLSFDAKRIEDGLIQPLAKLQHLESLAFPSSQFTTAQVAWLRARLPSSLKSRSLEPLWTFRDSPLRDGGTKKDVLIVGRGKPWLSSKPDAKRIERYEAEFWRMVDEFREDPELQPDKHGAGPAQQRHRAERQKVD